MAGVCRRRLLKRPILFLAMTVSSLVAAPAALADVTSVGGGAFGASLVGPTTLIPAPTVTLPPTGGGPFTASGPSTPPYAGDSTVITLGGNLNTHFGFAQSAATVNGVSVPGVISASSVQSVCMANGTGVMGSATFAGLTVQGVPITTPVAPNTVIPLSGLNATLTLNEQIVTRTAGVTNSITVNAIHLETSSILGDYVFIVGQSRCVANGPDVSATSTFTGARLASLTATRTRSGVTVRWRAAADVDVLGYNVYREIGGVRVRVNGKLIAANNGRASAYSFLDRRAPAATRPRYWIQVVSLGGAWSWYGPMRVALR